MPYGLSAGNGADCGLMLVKDHALLGLGLMLAVGEIPRIAGQFGLDTSTKANLMSTVYTAQTAVNMTKTVVQAVAKLVKTSWSISVRHTPVRCGRMSNLQRYPGAMQWSKIVRR